MGTLFVVEHGPDHPSLRIAPQVPQSIYYAIPRVVERFFGRSEIAYRLPSILLMGLALFLIAKIAQRLIHRDAAWFAVFAALSLKGINYEASDARPYALAICISSVSALFLIRWLDNRRWLDAALFVIFAALLWRVHLIFWPLYGVFAIYALVRISKRDTSVSWIQAAGGFAIIAVLLAPVAMRAVALNREAAAHVVVDPPDVHAVTNTLKFLLVGGCAAGAWIWSWFAGPRWKPRFKFDALIMGWWLIPTALLFAYWMATGNSVFVPRYLTMSLPGVALAATLATSWFLPVQYWRCGAIVMGIGALIAVGQWSVAWPPHHNSDWRGAARAINGLSLPPDTPVICPSPFVEAKPPVWTPDYPLPGFLYAPLPVYPISGRIFPFPFENSSEAEANALRLARSVLATAGAFVIYGGDRNVHFWRDWFHSCPELAAWPHRSLGKFGDVEAEVFERP